MNASEILGQAEVWDAMHSGPTYVAVSSDAWERFMEAYAAAREWSRKQRRNRRRMAHKRRKRRLK